MGRRKLRGNFAEAAGQLRTKTHRLVKLNGEKQASRKFRGSCRTAAYSFPLEKHAILSQDYVLVC
jgi:hypothetical protein